jgi:hypothetical protein
LLGVLKDEHLLISNLLNEEIQNGEDYLLLELLQVPLEELFSLSKCHWTCIASIISLKLVYHVLH